ncbi:DUF481 domain-containing protein [Bythopirellula polymerisocia]|nr:DUF481 domain-containing protein [Bythopirellula polymerisocia]
MSYLRITLLRRAIGALTLVMACCCALMGTAADKYAGPAVLPPPGSQLQIPNPTEFSELLLTPPEGDFGEDYLSEEFASIVPAEEILEPFPVYRWYQAAYWFGPTPWDMGIQFGLNGSEGANQTQSLQVGGHWKRKTKAWKFNSKIAYNRTSANQVETQNNALLDVRLDRPIDGSPWSLFALNQTLYDEFQAYDLRVSLNTGVGYQWCDTETFDLEGRFGIGTSREFGGPDNRWTREALFGLESEYLLSKTQRLTAKVDYFPEFEDFNQYRVVTDAGWEIDLDRPSNVSLKFSVNDRYDSTPNGVDPSLLNYSAVLIWGL